jgi:hypothetical protein
VGTEQDAAGQHDAPQRQDAHPNGGQTLPLLQMLKGQVEVQQAHGDRKQPAAHAMPEGCLAHEEIR